MTTNCTSEPFLYQHCGLWHFAHVGDECNNGAHAEYDTLLEALEAHPEVKRIDYDEA